MPKKLFMVVVWFYASLFSAGALLADCQARVPELACSEHRRNLGQMIVLGSIPVLGPIIAIFTTGFLENGWTLSRPPNCAGTTPEVAAVAINSHELHVCGYTASADTKLESVTGLLGNCAKTKDGHVYKIVAFERGVPILKELPAGSVFWKGNEGSECRDCKVQVQ